MDTRLVLPIGAILHGDYRILRVVGSGGFGITYEAEDMSLGTTVAIKEYYPVDFGDRDATMGVRPKSERHKPIFEKGRSNFLDEARLLARFEHPSIVRVTRVLEVCSTPYMVMRFERGQIFDAWLKARQGPPTQAELDRIAAPLLDALEVLHAADFLHRDIAPDNIIIRDDGTPVLLDFGAARRAVAEASRSLTGIVKAGYSPHEQYATDGRLQGPWTDFYALGGTLYRAVTGKAPEEATLRVDEDRIPPATQAAHGIYRPAFLAAIDSCLKVRAAERPQSVAQLRPIMIAPGPQPTRRVENSRTKTQTADRVASVRQRARRWPAVAAMVTVLGGAYAGYEYRRGAEAEPGWLSNWATIWGTEMETRSRQVTEAAQRRAAREAQEREKEQEAASVRRKQIEIEEARRKAQDERQRIAALEEARRKKEEARKAEEEKQRIATLEEARRRENEALRKAEEEKRSLEERQNQAELKEAKRWQEMADAAEARARLREQERVRLAAIPDDAKRTELVRQVQQALKRSGCYKGGLTGRSNDAQPSLDKFVQNANGNRKFDVQRIELASATLGEFEAWLGRADAIKVELCPPAKVEAQKPAKTTPMAKKPATGMPESEPAPTRRKVAQPQARASDDASARSGTEARGGGRGWVRRAIRSGQDGGGSGRCRRCGAAPLVNPTPE